MNHDPSRSCAEAGTDASARRAKYGRRGSSDIAASRRVSNGGEPTARNLQDNSAGHDRKGYRRKPPRGKQRRENDARIPTAKSADQQPMSHRQTSDNHATITQHCARHGGGTRHSERTCWLCPGAVSGSLRSLSYGNSAAGLTTSGSSELRSLRSSVRLPTNVAAVVLPPDFRLFSPPSTSARARQRTNA